MYTNFNWVNEHSQKFIQRDYLAEGQTVPERVRVIADRFQGINGIEGIGDKFYDYMSRGFYSLSSPVWSNYATTRGLPVSCFNSDISDNMENILFTAAEVGMLSKFGGGTSGYFGKLRPRGAAISNNGESFGAVHFMGMFDKVANVVSQGSVRRGQFSPYIDIDHGDFYDFVKIGTEEHTIQNTKHGVCVSDDFMNRVRDGDEEAQDRWAEVLRVRSEKGVPYIFFTDTVNRDTVDVYKENNMKINASNMCTEIALPSSPDESFVCVLSSMNISEYDEWKNTDAVEVLTMFLDSVVTEFLERIDEMNEEIQYLMRRVRKFAKEHRALGVGVLGWHAYLLKNEIPFESREAAKLNLEIFKKINNDAYKASGKLAEIFGEPKLLKGKGRRNTTLLAVAPTKSSSYILGQVSMSIEPEFSNYYVKDCAKDKMTWKNPYLVPVLERHNQNTKEVWLSIRAQDGSVQHLDFLTDQEKQVFKTIYEIDPEAILNQAAVRQPYIDQGQSINIMVDPQMPTREINRLYFTAWELGLKTLYYQYSLSEAQAFMRERAKNEGCIACEG